MFELFKKHSVKTFFNSSKNEQITGNKTLLLSQFRGDIWKLAYNNMLSEEGLIKELISAIGGFFDAERCVFSRIKNDKIFVQAEWKHNRVKTDASNFSVPLDIIERLGVDRQRTVTLKDMMDAISGPKMDFLKPVIHAMAAAIGSAPSLSTPINVNNKLFGFITMRFFNSKVEMYTKNVKDVITDAANIIALAIERRRSEEMFRASFDLNPDAMIFVNVSDGLIFDVNEGFSRTSGYSREEATGKTTRGLNLWHSEAEREEIVAALKKDGIVKNKEMKFRRKDGDVITCLYSSMLINLNSEPKVFTIIKDISGRIEIETKLAASEEKFRTSFNLNPDAMIITRVPDSAIIDVNEGFVSLSGYSKKEVIGKTTVELGLWQDFKDRDKIISKLKSDGFVGAEEIRFMGKNHKNITALFSSRIISLDDEQCFLSVIKDITDRKKIETKLAASEEKFRVAFNTSPDAINLNRLKDGMYAEINEGFTKLTGFTKDDVAGKTSADIKIWADLKDREKPINALKEKGIIENLEAKFRIKDGSLKTALMSARIVILDGEPHILSVTKDISERKTMEEKIISTSEKLKKAVDYLEKTNAELERFAYVASHDLQEPLRMVSNYAQLLSKKYKGRLDSDADDYIGYMTSGVQRMKLLINDILVFSRIGYGKPEIESVDVNELLKQITATLHEKITVVNASVTYGQLPRVEGVKTELLQVFQNLISNSLKFISKERKPEIIITAESKGAEWIFCVKDNGIGIQPQYFGKLFIIFERLHTKDEYEGTGIGLSICKKIIENHGGRIWVESEPGKGAAFYFSIPQEPQRCKVSD